MNANKNNLLQRESDMDDTANTIVSEFMRISSLIRQKKKKTRSFEFVRAIPFVFANLV